MSARTTHENAVNQVINVAFGEKTTLNELFGLIRERVAVCNPAAAQLEPVYRDFRAGDVRHSLGDINNGKGILGYEPEYSVRDGLDKAAKWYGRNLAA